MHLNQNGTGHMLPNFGRQKSTSGAEISNITLIRSYI